MGKGKFKSKKYSQNDDIEDEEEKPDLIKTHTKPVDYDEFEEEDEVPKWYEQYKNDTFEDDKPPTEDELVSFRIEAQNVLDGEIKIYNTKQGRGKKGDSSWIKTILSKGTARDRVAAHVVSIQNSPVHNVNLISSLLGMVKAAKKKECILVMDTLSDLFLEDLLRPDKKLKSFDKQPLTKLDEITSGCARARKLKLSAWLFEDKLKDLYEQFIQALETVAKDTIEANRIKAVSIMYKLLSNHPEKEKELLQGLINKLGDPSQKVVAKVIYCLTQLLRVHPNMKQIIMDEVEKLLFRTNMSTRTQYYCICFLSQFIFQDKDSKIAKNMLNIYFSFFKANIKKGEVDSRLMGALLMGVKRAYPFAKGDDNSLSQHVDTLYKLVHLTPFNISLHALCLLQQVSNSNDDRFYSALYKKLLDPKLATSCLHAMLINLLYKSLIKDTNVGRVKAFIKRLFQICLYLPVPLTCGVLYFVSQLISKRKKDLYAMVLQKQEDLSSTLDKFDSDEEEIYVDVDKEPEKEEEPKERKPAHGWVYSEFTSKGKNPKTKSYDPFARNPAFSNTDQTAYLELLQISEHFHPTVKLFANKILNKEMIIYSGDPLSDFTINRFLERFVFKNPKSVKNEEDGLTKGPDPQLASRKYYIPQGAKSMNVTSDNYLNQSQKQIPVDELFLYNYLKEKQEIRQRNKIDDDDDNDSVASEEFEEMIDKMVGKKHKELDFLDDIGENLNKKNRKQVVEEEDDDDEEEMSDEDMDDDDDDMDDMSDNEDVMEFGSDEEFDGDLDLDEALSSKKKKSVKDPFKKKNKKNEGLESLFAPAEEFAEILEEAGSSYDKPGMISSVQNKDNAAPKQLAWEKKRDVWRDDKRNKRKMAHNPKFNKKPRKK